VEGILPISPVTKLPMPVGRGVDLEAAQRKRVGIAHEHRGRLLGGAGRGARPSPEHLHDRTMRELANATRKPLSPLRE
jgi:hypothetical protein